MEFNLERDEDGFKLNGKQICSQESLEITFGVADYCENLCKNGREHESSGMVQTLLQTYLAALNPSSRHKFVQDLQKVISAVGNESYKTYDEYLTEQRKLDLGHD